MPHNVNEVASVTKIFVMAYAALRLIDLGIDGARTYIRSRGASK